MATTVKKPSDVKALTAGMTRIVLIAPVIADSHAHAAKYTALVNDALNAMTPAMQNEAVIQANLIAAGTLTFLP